jgi:hypothetical protein
MFSVRSAAGPQSVFGGIVSRDGYLAFSHIQYVQINPYCNGRFSLFIKLLRAIHIYASKPIKNANIVYEY